jgi:hypothetical protein
MSNPDPNDPREQLRRLREALDDEPPGDEEARETVTRLGIDIPALAARLRARAAEAAARAARDSVRPEPHEAAEADVAWILEMLAEQRRARAREGQARWAGVRLLRAVG